MGYITPDSTCDCCAVCESFDCALGDSPLDGTDSRVVTGFTITITNPVTTNLHSRYSNNPIEGIAYQGGVPKNYIRSWLQITNLNNLLGNYVIPRLVEGQCFSSEIVIDDIAFNGATIWGATAVDANNCPSGTITSWTAVPLGGAITWKVTAGFSNTLGFNVTAVMVPPPDVTTAFFTNGLDPGVFPNNENGDPERAYDPDLVGVPGIGITWLLERSSIKCNGGTLNQQLMIGPVGGSFPPCTGYPATSGLLASYTLDT